MIGLVRQTFPLGAQWPTLDPFLFCAHHLDRYPAGDGGLAPAAPLDGRSIGSDFAGIDGWNMYHGSTVPGFPQHPHRGFETVTYVRQGWCDHSDSLGAQARFGNGDVQWITAGSGIVHSEMFPLIETAGDNTLHLFQIWLNLPARSKMVDAYFSMLWAEELPVWRSSDGGAEAVIIAGSIDGATAPAPPPDSWASDPAADLGVWHVRVQADGAVILPPAPDGTDRVVYLFEGRGALIGGREIENNTGVVVDATRDLPIVAGAEDIECLVLTGRPIGEPVARYGPFVMNSDAEIRQAFADYQRTGFGGWPWPTDDPTHGSEPRRFARTNDTTIEPAAQRS